jgi:hypothetical protein
MLFLPWEDLPNTFRDAINFTYRPGWRYLWKDSLCIVQGSITDLRQAGNLMAEIYESTLYVTLAAIRVSNPTEGCFSIPIDEEHCTRSMTFPREVDGKVVRNHKVHVCTPLEHVGKKTLLNRGGEEHTFLLKTERCAHNLNGPYQCRHQSGWFRLDQRNQRRLAHYQRHLYTRLVSFELE